MKKLLFTLVLLLSSVVGNAQTSKLGDVNKDSEVNVSDVMTVVDVIMNGYKPLTLNSENVVVNVGSSATVDISFGYGPYTVTCSNEFVVGVSLNGTLLNIMGKHFGTAVVTVTDTATGYTKDINVTVEKSYRFCPDDNHPHLIDLGLPSGTLWACCNVDTDHPENQSPENYGGYYSWGETETKRNYSRPYYQYYKDGSYQSIGSDIAGTEYDVAHVKWGGSWVMASYSQQQELLDNCKSTWTTQNGVSGTLFTGTNGGKIFLPAAGYRVALGLNGDDTEGHYLSSSQDPSNTGGASFLYSNSSGAYMNNLYRHVGQSVRPVVSVSPVGNLELSTTELVLDHPEGDVDGVLDYEEIISGSGFYTVASSDENVAYAFIYGNFIKIAAFNAGTATITVTDERSGQTATIWVTVSSNNLCPDDHHPHMIDLGLPSGTKWACCNVDSDPEKQSPKNLGSIYAWGETETKSYYDESAYKYYKNGLYQYIGSDIAGTKYDVAHVKWGGSWVMPSAEQLDELRNNCTSVMDGFGRKFTSKKNGKSILLPLAGWCHGSTEFIPNIGDAGYYWSSTEDPSSTSNAYSLSFDRNYAETGSGGRDYGHSVRPVASVSPVVNLELSTTELVLTEGGVDSEEITSGSGFYTVASSDRSVATATLQGYSIKITAVSAGTATITVTDTKSGQTATIEVTVKDKPQSYLTCPDNHHPHLIDLGLPSGTKWACCNVDTDHPENQSPTNYGGYYAWGETVTKSYYGEYEYQYYKTGSYQSIGSDIAGTEYDVAHVKWGGSWVMASHSQQQELLDNCASTWTKQNGVNGRLFTGTNGGSIFLPAAGGRYDSLLIYETTWGFYWSSTQDPSEEDHAYYLQFDSDGASTDSNGFFRFYGFGVRPVVRN